MFFRRQRPENNPSEEEILRERLRLLIEELEHLKTTAEEKIQYLEDSVALRMQELEDKLAILEERLCMLNKVLASLDPSNRLN